MQRPMVEKKGLNDEHLAIRSHFTFIILPDSAGTGTINAATTQKFHRGDGADGGRTNGPGIVQRGREKDHRGFFWA